MKDEKQIELSFIKKLEELKYVYREDIKDKGKDTEHKNSEVEQLDFEFVLFSSVLIDYDYIMALIARYTQAQSAPQKQKVTKEELIGMLSAVSNFLDEKEDIIEYINLLQAGVALDERQIKEGYQRFRKQKNNQEIHVIAEKHGIFCPKGTSWGK